MPKAWLHDLRHTAASWMVMHGVSIYMVQAILGHSDVATTMRYAHLAPDSLRPAMSMLDEMGEMEMSDEEQAAEGG